VGGLKNGPAGEQLSYETWQARREVLGPEDHDTLDSMDTYGTSLAIQKKYEQAEKIYRDCLELRGRVLKGGTNDSDYLVTLGNLGLTLGERGNLTEAERVMIEVIDRRTRAGLGNTTDTFANINNLGMILLASDRTQDAERLISAACQRAALISGHRENPLSTLRLQHLLARIFAEERRFDEAEKLAEQVLAILRRVASSHETTARTLLILGRVKMEKAQQALTAGDAPTVERLFNEAEPLLHEALDVFREHCTSRRELVAQAANWLGAVQVARRSYPEAEILLLTDPEQFFTRSIHMSSAERRAGVGHIVQLYEAWDKPDQVAIWRKKLDELGPATR